jgi:phage terminase small subunit
MPGPPPKPLEQKRRAGNPGKRPLPSLQSTFALEHIPTTPPDELDVAGQMLWIHVASLPWVSTSDAAALIEVCKDADLAQGLREDIAARGEAYEVRGRWLPNPSLASLATVAKRLHTGLSLFGLTPADRTRLGIAEIKARSKFEELQDRKLRTVK